MAEPKEKQIEVMEKTEKRIEVVEVRLGDLVGMDGNPRKISPRKKNELRKSFEMFGDFGIRVIDEQNRIISGHQSVDTLIAMYGEDATTLCKRLIGYSEPELKAINIKANTHSGEWDLDKLAAWTADLNIDLGLDLPQKDAEERIIRKMELIRYEKYDYVMIVCRNEIDYLNLVRALGIEGQMISISKGKNGERKIKARAIWYDKMNAKIVPK